MRLIGVIVEKRFYFEHLDVNGDSLFRFCRNNKLLLWVTFAVLLLSYGGKLLNFSLGIDSEMFSTDPDGFFRFDIQRNSWGLVVIHKLLFIDEFNPILLYTICLGLIFSFTVFWCYMVSIFNKTLEKNNTLLLLALPLVTSPVWSEHFYFVYFSPETAGAILAVPFIVYLVFDGVLSLSWKKLVLAFPLLVLILAIYQGIVFLLAFAILVFSLILLQNTEYALKDYIHTAFWVLLFFFSGIVAWVLAGNLIQIVFGVGSVSYVEDFSTWGKVPLTKSLSYILIFCYEITVGNLPFVRDFVVPLMSRFATHGQQSVNAITDVSRVVGNFFIIPVAILFVLRVLKSARFFPGNGKKVLFIVLGLLSAGSVLLVPILGGAVPPVRAMYILAFYLGFMLFFLSGPVAGRSDKGLLVFCMIAASLTTCYQVQINSQLHYNDYLRYQNDVQIAHDIGIAIRPFQPAGHNVPLALVGARHAGDDLPQVKTRGEVIGHSFFEWGSDSSLEASTRGVPFMETLGIDVRQPSDDEMNLARERASSMAIFPAEGSVTLVEGLVIVKLSESTFGGRASER